MITNDLNQAITQLTIGNIVAIPTETVYGLAGNATNKNAITQIFKVKNRPLNHPLIMHVAEGADITQWVSEVPSYAKLLMDAFWPGPLTLVFNCKPGAVDTLVTGGQNTVALRCPKHPITQTLLKSLDFPLVAPSANPFGKISPTTAEHVQQSFLTESFLILDGGRCTEGIESTIINASHRDSYQILRHGTLSEEEIQKVIHMHSLMDTSTIRVPGKLDQHYQPEKPLYCFQSASELLDFCAKETDVYVLSFEKTRYKGHQLSKDPKRMAYELYYELRLADESSAKVIAIELPPEDIAWEGVRERVLKASTR